MDKTPSNFLRHIPCENPKCGSTDANSLYDDNHQFCFACNTYVNGDGSSVVKEGGKSTKIEGLMSGEYRDLVKRKIHETTCRKFGYTVGEHHGKAIQIAPYYDKDGNLVAQKIRYPDKTFRVVGSLKNAMLFGAQLWNGGRKIVITEGEIDALSVAQIQNLKWATVSVPNGAQGAKKAIASNLEYLNQFEEVIFMFDMDEVGQKAAIECAELLPPSKAKIAVLPLKDGNECLVAGQEQEVITAIWNAKTYRPDGLVGVSDLIGELDKPITLGLPWFLEDLTKLTFGRRWGEVYGLGAGTGVGKTDFLTQQIDYDISVLKQKVGLIFLEQKPLETVIRVAGKHDGKRYHVPDGTWTVAERKAAVQKLDGLVTLYDSFGQTDWGVISNKIRFMKVSEGISIFYLDHLTAMADTADEKGSLEEIMKQMASLANELQIIIHFVSHLSTPEGKPHEEGGHVSIRHFKGSRAIGFWSYFMFGLERNQQAEDPVVRGTTTLRILKDRYTGQATGCLLYMGYDPNTGRLFPTEKPKEESHGFGDETEF